MIFACVTGIPRALVAHRMHYLAGFSVVAERVTRAEAEPQALKQTPCGLCRVLRGSPCGDAGADGGTRTRDLFLTKEWV